MNQKILKVGRFAKYLILHFANNKKCLIHLGMSGTIHFVKKNKKNIITNTSFYNSPKLPNKHNHIEIFSIIAKLSIMIPEDLVFLRSLKMKNF